MATLKVGDEVPDFELPAVIGNIKQRFKLSDYRGKNNIVVAFYPADWTPVCASQLPGLNADLERFAGYDAQIVGISTDSIPSHTAWQKKEIGILNYPLASDFYPHGQVANLFGILREGDPLPGVAERAIFVIDKKGKLAFGKVYPIGQVPDNSEIFEVLRKL
ncbi:MAG: redoxin domain-containing protein [Acidobacteriota bacterium]|nr:redoxin domain-containing protein [Acidobacteriota bacterium]